MLWVYFVLISIVTNSGTALLQRVLMKNDKSHAVAYSSVFQLLGGLLILAAAFINGFKMPPISDYPLNFALMILLYTGSAFFQFKAFQTIEASDATILGTTSSIWTIIMAVLFLGETFSFNQFLGAILIFLAVFLVAFKKKAFQFNQGVVYIFLFAACNGFGLVNDAFILNYSEIFSYTALTWLLPGFTRLILWPKAIYHFKPLFQSEQFKKMLLLVFFSAISSVTFYLAYKSGGPISILSPIFSSKIILTVILAALILNERDRLFKKLIAAVVAIFGILLIR